MTRAQAILPFAEYCTKLRADVERLEKERDAARATITELNRRCQAAESAARQTADDCRRKGVSFGRGLANWAWADERRKQEALRADMERLTTELELMTIERDTLREQLNELIHPVAWSGSPGMGENCGPVSDADPLPWEAGPPDAAHAAADAGAYTVDADYDD